MRRPMVVVFPPVGREDFERVFGRFMGGVFERDCAEPPTIRRGLGMFFRSRLSRDRARRAFLEGRCMQVFGELLGKNPPFWSNSALD